MRKASIHICRYEQVEQLFSRHHTSGFSRCEKKREIPLDDVLKLLPEDLGKVLTREGEVVLTDPDLIAGLAGTDIQDPLSCYAVIRVED